jgi:transposase
MKIQKCVGLDVHKDKTTVAIAEGDRTGEVRAYGEISSDLVTTEKAPRKIKGEHGVLHVAYEAGPTGFVLYRRLQQLGFECILAHAAAQGRPAEDQPPRRSATGAAAPRRRADGYSRAGCGG